MEKCELLPPDELDIETEIENIIENGDRKQISRFSHIKYGRLCAMIRSDDATRNTIYETASFIYGVLRTDRSKGKKVFNVLYRLAVQWGLVDEEPVDIIELAIRRLRSIDRDDMAKMSRDQVTVSLARTAELELEAGRVKSELIAEQRVREFEPIEQTG
jgi:hypothetical protein